MVDFSYLEPYGYREEIAMVCRGKRLGDNRLHWILSKLEPPLLGPENLEIVLNELDETKPRPRGQPVGGIATRKIVADKLDNLVRKDVPAEFLNALACRLRSGKRYPISANERKADREATKARSVLIFRTLYHDVLKALQEGKSSFEHPSGLSIQFPDDLAQEPNFRKALMIVHQVVSEKFGMQPPSLRRLHNIVSSRS